MQLSEISKPVIIVVGPTGVGKSEFAVHLAETIKAEIVSADSRLFYKGMDIGTAKPNQDLLSRVHHHLINEVNPNETWSLAEFQARAKAEIEDIHARGKPVILVGGTGQYIHAILEEWTVPAQQPNLLLRELLASWVEEIGKNELHKRLELLDPVAAGFIAPSNVRRTIRGLEVILLTGRRFSEQRQKGASLYNTITIGLYRSREELYPIIDKRIDEMMASGFLAEVEGLLRKGYSPDLPAFSAIGYKQLIQYLQGKMSLEEAIREMKRMTRIFIRRQSNWFRNDDPDINWLEVDSGLLEKAIRLLFEKGNWRINAS